MATIKEADYCFVVENRKGESVLVEFHDHEETARQQYAKVWQKLSQAVQNHHSLAGGPPAPEWTAWKPGDWCNQQQGYENRLKLVAWCGSHLIGFLHLWPDFESIHQMGKRVLYLEHMGAAPGNMNTELWEQRYSGVGSALFAYSVLLSHLRGFEGRLGLHAANDSALGFYSRLHAECGNALFYSQQSGVSGPTPHSAGDLSKPYLETREDGATHWLEEYRRG
jgi:hypothetical protein